MSIAAQRRPAPTPVEATAWSTLVRAGLADGAARALGDDRFDDAEVRAAFDALPVPSALDQTSRELLLAWLCALRDHFRSRFNSVLGDAGGTVVAALEQTPIDRGRFLKLRRISIERLAGLV